MCNLFKECEPTKPKFQDFVFCKKTGDGIIIHDKSKIGYVGNTGKVGNWGNIGNRILENF